jgi:transcriptional regulator with XRE-family HTH domain
MLVKQAVGEILRERRAALGLTLAEVAASASVSLQYLSELERGRKEASSELLDAVTGALGLRASTVMLGVAQRLEPLGAESAVELESSVAEVVELAPRPDGAQLLAA